MDGNFSIFNIFTLLGGLAFFLYGMNVMSTGLEKLTGGKLEVALKKMTSTKFMSIILGMVVTIAIQSSSAMTVMLVGFVNSGLMALEQTIAVCFGSNIGTTFTAWILCLNDIKTGDSNGAVDFALTMLKPKSFSPIIALIGVIMIMASKKNKKKDIGRILVGFAVLMTGMTIMGESVSPLKESEKFQQMLTAFENPVLGVLVGAGFTGIIQSSAGAIGILMTFSGGTLTYGMAFPVIMGCNIGTCVTALLSTFGVSKDAKRVACIHLLVKIMGTIVILSIIMILQNVMNIGIFSESVGYLGIAVMHTIFNVATTVMFLPFTKQLVWLSHIVVSDKKGNDEPVDTKHHVTGLDERFLKTPAVAVETCRGATVEMANITRDAIEQALELLVTPYDEKKAQNIIELEDIIDHFEDEINGYLIRISKSSITGKDSRKVSKMMHCVGNFERLSDHAVNLVESAQECHEKGIGFSQECIDEMKVISEAITQNVDMAIDSYITNDLALAHKVEPLEEVVDNLSTELKNRHIRRLQNDECTVELGYIFQDILTNLERVSDHCSNIAGCLIETDEKTNIHAYLHDIKENDETFRSEFRAYTESYFAKLESIPSVSEK